MKQTYTLLALAMALLTASCSSSLDKIDDTDGVPSSEFYHDESAYLSALTGCYTQMRSTNLYGGTLTLTMMDYASQDMQPQGNVARAAASLNFTDGAIKATVDSMARAAYGVIASCNKLIEETEKSNVVFFNSGQKEIILGEAYAMRAAIQFDMLRLFHPAPQTDASFTGLPYITTFGNRQWQPLPTSELLRLINADLDRAAALLQAHDPIMQNSNPTNVRAGQIDRRLRTFQLNYYAVKAISARVATWQGDWQRAKAEADTVFMHLSNTDSRYQLFYWVTPGHYGSDFSFSREYVFGISSTPTGFTALSDSLYNNVGITTTADLRNIYSDNADIRYRAWFRQDGNGAYTMAQKFGSQTLLSGYISTSSSSATELPAAIPYIKLGEVALIRAEALNETGHTTEALQAIKEMESYKNATAAQLLEDSGNVTQAAVRSLIADEYRRDLFGEGQTFYLYKRLGLTSITRYDGTTMTVSPSQYTIPIPENLLTTQR